MHSYLSILRLLYKQAIIPLILRIGYYDQVVQYYLARTSSLSPMCVWVCNIWVRCIHDISTWTVFYCSMMMMVQSFPVQVISCKEVSSRGGITTSTSDPVQTIPSPSGSISCSDTTSPPLLSLLKLLLHFVAMRLRCAGMYLCVE